MTAQFEATLRPLTHPQKRVWLVEQLFPGTPIHNLAGAATYARRLDFGRLEAAFNQFTRVHEATRIRLVRTLDNEARQYVAPWKPLSIGISDFSGERAPRQAFEAWLDVQCRLPFDLLESPLFRVEFFRISENECGYFVNFHHIIADGWSTQALGYFVSRAYQDPDGEPPIGPGYFEFAEKELLYAQSKRFLDSKKFWLQELDGVSYYPVDRAGTAGEQRRLRLSPNQTSALRSCAADIGVPLGTLLTALLFLYLGRSGNTADVVIGMPVLNRTHAQKNSIGMYTSTMPVRIRFQEAESIHAFVRRVQAQFGRCLRHQRYPFDLLIRDLSGDHATGQLFRACANVYNTNLSQAAEIDGTAALVEECFVGKQLFPLYVVVKSWAQDDTLEIDINYKPSLYSEDEIESLQSFLVDAIAATALETSTEAFAQMHLGSSGSSARSAPKPDAAAARAASSETPDDIRFPATGLTGHDRSGDRRMREIPFVFPATMRLDVERNFGGMDEAFGRLLVSGLGVLLGRCCSVQKVQLGIAGLGFQGNQFAELACEVESGATAREIFQRVGSNLADASATNTPDNFRGAVVDLGTGNRPDPICADIVVRPPDEDGIGRLLFDANIYDDGDAELIGSRLAHVVGSMASSPDSRIGDIEVVDTIERLRLEGFNETARAFPDTTTVVQLFEAWAARDPDIPALRTSAGIWSYARLNRRANAFAGLLRARGIGRGSIVPVMLERSPELMVGIFGILKAGGAYLPIDPSYPKSRIEFILADSNASCIVSTAKLLGDSTGCDLVEVGEDESDSNVGGASGPRDLAYVCYTSGSTGKPKGAMIEHRSLVNRLHWMQRAYPLNTSDVLLQKTSISFDVSVWELFWWSLTGASLCLTAQGDEKDPERLVKCIERNQVTVIHFVPSMLQAFLGYIENVADRSRLRSLRRVFASGEALRPDHVNSFNRLFDQARLTNLYGPTEATIDVTYHDCPAAPACKRVPIGRPIDNTHMRILGSTNRLQPIGAPGELYIGGVGVARGYLNRSELTAQRFVDDPYSSQGRLYRTGDLARWLPNGEIEFIGRNDDQIKLRGFRIEIGEIESTLREHPLVQDAVVAVRKSLQGNQQLCGFVVLKAPCPMDELQQYLTDKIPPYMVPSSLKQVSAIPLGTTGKADRAALLASSVEDDVVSRPMTPDEAVLGQIWEEVLELPRVEADQNFFAVGGDSIKVISLVSKARLLGKEITAEDVYRNPTVRELALVARSVDGGAAVSPHQPFELLSPEDRSRVAASAEDAFPLSALQHGLIFQSQIIRETPFYHDVFSYRIKGPFDAAKFEHAVTALCRNNTIFRTSYHMNGFSEPIQVVHRDSELQLKIRDLRALPAEQQDAAIKADVSAIRKRRFDWERPSLIGFDIHLLSDTEYVYTINFHDSALDGWSVNLIHRQLFQHYYSLLLGEPRQVRPPAATFRQFVEIERNASADPGHKAFWQNALDGSSFLRLPRYPKQDGQDAARVDFHELRLPDGLSDQIKQTAIRLGVPVKTVLLAAHVSVLSLLTGEHDIVTGYEYGVRPETTDSDAVIGLFLNTLPFRIKLTKGSWQDLIRSVYRTEIDFVPYRRYPMVRIKQDHGARGLLFESVFNFTHFHILSALKRLPGFDLMEVMVRAETEFPFRFECSIHPFTENVLLWIHYHANVFPREQIETIGRYYVRSLEALVRDPLAIPNSESIIGADERRRQLFEFNDNEAELPRHHCFHHLFEQQVSLSPHRTAVTCGAVRWTYAQLNEAANKLAQAILRHTAGSPEVVGVAMQRGPAWIAAVIACFKAGCAYLPLDQSYPAERIATSLSQSGCRLVVSGSQKDGAGLSSGIAEARGASISFIYAEDELNGRPAAQPSVTVSHDDLAYIIFTSGSTGLPKGAMIRHGGMLNHLTAKVRDLAISSDDIVVQNASQCFDVSLWQLLSALLVGGQTAIFQTNVVLDADRFISALRNERISILEVVPSYLAVLLERLEAKPAPLGRLRRLLVTGEPVNARIIERWFAIFPDIAVVNAYGPTEAADDICHHLMTSPPLEPLVPVGRPIQNLNVYVLDRQEAFVPIGSVGEVCVSGIGVGAGYVNDAARTSAAFVADPFRPSLRMYKTGDMGRWLPDGILELVGRKDDQVKIRGYRIELGEVESHLQRSPGITQAAVVADAANAALIAFVVTDGAIDRGKIKRELSLRLPDYMIPARFVELESLPLSEHGKVAKQKLIEILSEMRDDIVPLSPPSGETERELSGLWADLLKVDVNRIGRRSNFFDLGGNSLKAMELALRAQERFSINDVFRYPELEDLARRIEDIAAGDGEHELLVDYGSAAAPQFSIVGFTYAGGNASNFKPLFDALRSQHDNVSCYAIELPRTSQSDRDFETVAERCASQIQANVRTPVVLWGHCSGSALALEVARRLEASSTDLRLIILGGKLINNQVISRIRSLFVHALSPFLPVEAGAMSARQIKRWLIRKTGFDGFAGLDEAQSLVVTEAFRHDATGAARFFDRACTGGDGISVKAPILNIVTRDDRLTRNYRKRYANWRIFSDRVGLEVLDSGGHYFIKTRPQETADILLRAVGDFDDRSGATADIPDDSLFSITA